jgi:membrane fusion protein
MFRAEVLARQPLHGSVLLARAPSHAALAALFGAAAAAVLAFLALAGVTRKVEVAGALLPAQGLVRIVAPQAGVVAARRVEEGRPVRAGDVLFVVGSERASSRHADVDQAVAALMRARRDSLQAEQRQLDEQAQQRRDAAARRADDLAAEIRRIDEQRALQQRRVDLAQAAVATSAELQAAGYVSAQQGQAKLADLIDQQQKAADLDRGRAAAARELDAARVALRELPLQAARDRRVGERDIASIEQELAENDARRRVVVRAPHDGTVAAIRAEPGQAVQAQQPLASLLPAGSELEAELYAPSRAVGFVKPGMDVLLRYEPYPYQTFGAARGRVREVAATALRADELPAARRSDAAVGEPLYRVRVALDKQTMRAYGVERALPAGAALDATVVLERRRLIDWILDPLYAVAGRGR